jgi:CubicO group peptidase (beta-lactamase class C family)
VTGLGTVLHRAAGSVPAPAVAISVFTVAGPLAETCTGVADLDTGRPAHIDESQWDLASLTKVLVTLLEVLALIDAGAFGLDDPFHTTWPRAYGTALGGATVRQVLSYAAGLPGSVPLFRTATGRAAVLAAALSVPPERPPGTGWYSDLNFLALGAMVEERTGRSLADLTRSRTGLTFEPVPARAVATERCPWRGRLVVGEVHDENAAAMGGTAGHAGAFGTLAQVRQAARAWLAGAVVSRDLHTAARTCWATNADGDRYGLGWWLPPTREIGGTRPGPDSFGMSGFVGNRIWLEPGYGYGIVVLSNRIHPVRADRAPFTAWATRLLDEVAAVLR